MFCVTSSLLISSPHCTLWWKALPPSSIVANEIKFSTALSNKYCPPDLRVVTNNLYHVISWAPPLTRSSAPPSWPRLCAWPCICDLFTPCCLQVRCQCSGQQVGADDTGLSGQTISPIFAVWNICPLGPIISVLLPPLFPLTFTIPVPSITQMANITLGGRWQDLTIAILHSGTLLPTSTVVAESPHGFRLENLEDGNSLHHC